MYNDNNYPNDFDKRNGVDEKEKEVDGGHEVGAAYTRYSRQSDVQENNAYGTNTYGTNTYNTNTYNTQGSSGRPPKKEKKIGLFMKKIMVNVCLGLFFGVCAGLGILAVQSSTDFLGENDKTSAATAAIEEEQTQMTQNQGNSGGIEQTEQVNAVVTDVTDVVGEVMPSIVAINNTYTQTMSYFGQTMSNESTSAGSGIIVGQSDSELLIVSNHHVVSDADSLIIQFVDGTEAQAQIKGSDSSMDLAVIAVALDDIEPATMEAIAIATLGDSDALTVGEPAIAIGNSLGYGQSVTVGVVSATDRIIQLSEEMNGTFIQTDAAINFGNSGGALLNVKGQVIGINSNKIGGSAIEGMGYAIPISAAKPIIEDLMLRETRTKVTEDSRGYLGVSLLNVVEQMTQDYGMPKGVYISQVFEGSAADLAGIVKGNIITEFDGNKITSAEDLMQVMEYYSQGDMVEVTVMYGSQNGWESTTLSVTLGAKG